MLGFLQGDGHHSEYTRNRGKIGIELAERDIDILDKIYTTISEHIFVGRSSRTRDTNFKNGYKSCCITIYNKDVRAELKEFIPISKKSSIITPPNNVIPIHYIRGLTDADGSIGISSNNKPFWSLSTSSENVKEFVIQHIKDVIGIEKRLNRNQRDNNYNIVLYNKDALFYTKLLYSSATLYLDRKYNKYLEIQNWARTVLKRKGRPKRWLADEDIIVLSNVMLDEKCLLLNRSKSSIKTHLWRLKKRIST